MAVEYDLYTTTDGGATSTLVASNINTGYQYPYAGTTDFFVNSRDELGGVLASNIEEGTAFPFFAAQFETDAANGVVSFTDVNATGTGIEWSDDAGVTWTTITSSPWTVPAAGNYEIQKLDGPLNIVFGAGGGLTAETFINTIAIQGKGSTSCDSMISDTNADTVDFTGYDFVTVTSMVATFQNVSLLTTIVTDPGADSTSVTDYTRCFADNPQLSTLDLPNLQTDSATKFTQMFQNCADLTSMNLGHFVTDAITDMSFMFAGCTGLTNLDVSNWNTPVLTSMESTFNGCTALVTLSSSTGWTTTNVTNFKETFRGCASLESFNTARLDTTSADDMSGMLQDCLLLKCLTGLDTRSATNKTDLFTNCPVMAEPDAASITDLTDADGASWVNGGTCPNVVTAADGDFETSSAAEIGFIDINSTGTGIEYSDDNGTTWIAYTGASPWTTPGAGAYKIRKTDGAMNLTFGNGNATQAAKFINSMTVSGGGFTSCESMFNGCSNITSINCDGMDVSNVTTVEWLMSSCGKVTSFSCAGWNTSKVTRAGYAFAISPLLDTLDISMWDMSAIVDIQGFMYFAQSLTTIGAPTWNTSSCTNFTFAFRSGRDCTDYTGVDYSAAVDIIEMLRDHETTTTLDISGTDFSNATNLGGMFRGCSHMTHLDFTSVTTMCAPDTSYGSFFADCTSLACITNFSTPDDITSGDHKLNMFMNTPLLTQPDATAQGLLEADDGDIWVNGSACP